MPSVPSRLAVACGCALALGLSSPALADKQPGKVPPPPLNGLEAPANGSAAGASAQHHTFIESPGPRPQLTANAKKGKGAGGLSKLSAPSISGSKKKQTLTASPNFTAKVAKPSKRNASSTLAAPTGSSAPAAAPTTPVAPSSQPLAPKHKSTHHAARNRGHHNNRSSGTAAPRPSVPVTRQVNAVPAGPAVPTRPAPPRRAKEERPDRGLARVRVSVVTRTVHDIVRVIPDPVKAVIGAMAALLLAAIAAWTVVTVRARRLRRQRGQLLQEVGLLQAALLPEIPAQIGRVAASVAYRPAEGPGAGGDFYDIFELENGNVGLVLGDVAGHGREALALTALLRYTLRAYLDTGLQPRTAMRLAGETLDHNLGGAFATAVVAVYDAEAGTLTYSCAGHPPPILTGPPAHEPVVACSAPPIGVGERTGIRQTTVQLPAGSAACFFTDGLADARVDGELFGRQRLAERIGELDDELTASTLIERIGAEVHHLPDDVAACVLRPLAGAAAGSNRASERVEELELREGGERDLRRFLAASGIPPVEIGDIIRSADARAEDYGGALVRVTICPCERPRVSLVLPVLELLGAGAKARRGVRSSGARSSLLHGLGRGQ